MRSPYPAVIVDEYQPLNSFVAAGSLATGIPGCQVPRSLHGHHRHSEHDLDQLAAARQFRRGYIESYNFTIQRELGAGFVLQTGYVGTRSDPPGVTYYEINAGLIPGAGANGRPLFVKYGVNVNRSFFIPMATNATTRGRRT